MVKGKSIILTLVLLLVMINFVSSAVTKCDYYGTSLNLKDQPLILIAEPYHFSVQPINSTDGVVLSNTTTACYFFLFDFNGNHQYSKLVMPYDSDNYDFYVNLTGENFTKVGYYPYSVVCQSLLGTKSGTCSGNFEVLGSRLILSTAHGIIYLLKFIIMFFLFFVVLFGAFKLPNDNESNEEGQLISIGWLKYLRSTLLFVDWIIFLSIFYLISNLSFAYLGEDLFAKLSFKIFQIGFVLTLPIVVLWFIWIFVQIAQDKKMKGLISKGIYPKSKYF